MSKQKTAKDEKIEPNIRDFMAGQAMSGMLSSGAGWADFTCHYDNNASWAYKIADVMIKARDE